MFGEMRVLVRSSGAEHEIAALCGGRLVEYWREKSGAQSLVGSIVLGRVERVLPAVGAAFVKIGEPRSGFLPLKEMESFEKSGHSKPLVTDAEVLVQVNKDAKDEKGAFLTRDIALAGLFCVFMPTNHHVGVSSRITDEQQRAYAQEIGKEIAGGTAGIIVRHAALPVKREEVQSEYEALGALWQELAEKARYAKAPSVLYRQPSMLTALLSNNVARYSLTVAASKQSFAEEIPLESIPFSLQTEVELDALWQSARVSQQVQEALKRQVPLANGGTLVIDEREALSTIDVNSARFVGKSGEKGIALQQNLVACAEIARQIRLRNLGGIILIDFIDMGQEGEREQVQAALSQNLAGDPAKTVIHGFTSLGLLEMTRKRTRESLSRLLTEPCEGCNESGRRLRKG